MHKVRAWHKKEERWINIGAFIMDDSGNFEIVYEYIDDNREYDHKIEDVILMWSTGIADKNKKKIFEGDIVEVKSDEGSSIYYVAFSHGCFWFEYHEEAEEVILINDFRDEIFQLEVKGNIYENPERMKEEQ